MEVEYPRCPKQAPFSLLFFGGVVSIGFLLFLVILVMGSYSKKEMVHGVIRNGHNIIIQGGHSGYIKSIHVAPGEHVTQGQLLLDIGMVREDLIDVEGEGLVREEAIQRLEFLLRLNESEAQDIERQLQQRYTLHEQARRLLDDSKGQMLDSMDLIERRIAILESQYREMYELGRDGLVPMLDVESHQMSVLEARHQKSEITQELRRLSQLEIDQNIRHENEITELAQRQHALTQTRFEYVERINDLRKEDGYKVLAPRDGVVDSLLVREGEQVNSQMSIVIMRSHSRSLDSLSVILDIPPRAVGLIDLSSEIIVRVDTFPYESYGVLTARVKNIPSASIQRPGASSEVYPVELEFYDDGSDLKIPLSALVEGMTVTAYIPQPSQSLLEWLFMPVKQAFIRNPEF